MTSDLTLYLDMASQPSRAVLSFCLLNAIPHQTKLVAVRSGENKSKEYLTINPNGKVPAMTEGDFTLYESHTIMKYLARSRKVADHWYPADLKKRARVDEYLDWHHTNLRQGSSPFVFFNAFPEILEIAKAPKEDTKYYLAIMKRCLKMMEGWLSEHKYLCGDEKTLADISACHELDQLKFLAFDLSPWPKVNAWLHHMIDQDPIMLNVASPLRALAFRNYQKRKAKL